MPTLILAVSLLTATGCRPNGDDNSTDADNGLHEGLTDSTKMPGFGKGLQADTIAIGDTQTMKRDTMAGNPR